jgi:hypothetical protein
MKNILLLTLIIPALSACSLVGFAVGTATKVVDTAVDVITENDTDTQNENDHAMAFTAE